jgi:hypothetical protein
MPVLDFGQKQAVRGALGGDLSNLWAAFIWDETPQGYSFWREVTDSGLLSQEVRDYLEELLGDEIQKEGEQVAQSKYQFRRVRLDPEGNLEFSEDSSRKIESYCGSNQRTDRNRPTYEFAVSGSYSRYIEFTGAYSYTIASGTILTVVEFDEEGNFKIFGELSPVAKNFGLKSLEEEFAFNLRKMGEFGSLTYDWEARGAVEQIVHVIGGIDGSDAMEGADMFRPVFMGDQVEVYMNIRDLDRGRRTKIRFGRFLKLILPKAPDSTLEQIQNVYRERFVKRDFTVHRGKERKDFRFAYNSDVSKQLNPATCSTRKSIANSCMQDKEIQGFSPAEMYASGDFEIIYLTDDKDCVAGRVVVWVGGSGAPQAGPLYGSCEHSLDLLQAEVDAMGAINYENASWKGAKLAKIEVYGGDLLACYSDLEQEAYDAGDHLVIGPGSIELCRTDGYTGYSRTYCESCEDPLSEDEVYTNDHGECFCEYCYHDRYFTCEVNHEETSRDDEVEVLTSNPRVYYGASVTNPRTISVDGRNVSYEECVHTGEVWLLDDMECDVDGDLVSPRYALNDMITVDGELYSPAQLKERGLDADGNEIEDDDADNNEEEEQAA